MASFGEHKLPPDTTTITTPEEHHSSSGTSGESLEDMSELRRVQLAHEGMRLLLSSEVRQAEELFRTSRYLGPELNAGYSFVQLVRAVMTFEDDSMEFAYKCLEGTEKFCELPHKRFGGLFSNSSSADRLSPHEKLSRKSIIADCILFEAILVFLKQHLTSYVKGGYLLRKAWKMYEKIYRETEELCRQPSPIVRDGFSSPIDKHVGSSIYDRQLQDAEIEDGGSEEELTEEEISAQLDGGDVMTALEQGLAGVSLDLPSLDTSSEEPTTKRGSEASQQQQQQKRKKPAKSLSSDRQNDAATDASPEPMRRLFASDTAKGVPRERSHVGGSDEPDFGNVKRGRHKKRPTSGFFAPEVPTPAMIHLEHEDARLRGAVYFGYGVMNIVMSLIPPKLAKLANLFGFHGDRRLGLQALEFASNSQDMKAPLARISLLWYHTIVRPFFALDGEVEDAGAHEAERLLDQAQSTYNSSPLFLYFRGKVFYLRCQLTQALQVYTEAASLARDQREVEHIVLYEKGWVHFLQLDYAQALPCYLRLKNETRWSACYYAYLAAVMTGMQGDLKQARELFLQTTKLVKRKNNNLEKFCSRRGSHYKKGESPLMPLEMRLMAIEVIYLWRALPFCSMQTKSELLDILNAALPPDVRPIHRAMTSWLKGGLLNSMGRPDEAAKCLHDVLQYEQVIKYDKHVLSFSLYELALIHIARDEFARARTLLNIAKDGYSGYEFEARLNFKVHSAYGLLR